jgi:NADH:ubiquinone oxidoreductase subunit 5 (subunit L)/multisubunit Na+/H+ antiporter MnhA subunit
MVAVPPFNGFVGEFLIYSGLLSAGAPSGQGVVLVCAAATLAFVGAIGALAATRAFGIGFLGSTRDLTLQVGDDAPTTMAGPMAVHIVAIIAIGLVPQLALALVDPALSLFTSHIAGQPARDLADTLSPVILASRLLALALALAVGLAWRRRASVRASVTWGCGYTAGTPRMQYTGSSFSAQLTSLFRPAMPVLTREHLPTEPFPRHRAHLSTQHVDAVEQRMFEVLGQGEQFVQDTAGRIPEQPRFAFAAGLVVIVVIALIVAGQVM